MITRGNLIFTCEHASAKIPKSLCPTFDAQAWEEHQLFDPGALQVANRLAKALEAPIFCGEYSRLLMDLNRSAHHPKVSQLIQDSEVKQDLIGRLHRPFREQCANWIKTRYKKTNRPVVHISVHSFVRQLEQQVRNADIGLLYDPSRPRELAIAKALKQYLYGQGWRTRFNYPYRGTADGHTTALRQQFSNRRYSGVEIEICNDLMAEHSQQIARSLVVGLQSISTD
jgi:predicted N-formylglutamate amidohydrolase